VDPDVRLFIPRVDDGSRQAGIIYDHQIAIEIPCSFLIIANKLFLADYLLFI